MPATNYARATVVACALLAPAASAQDDRTAVGLARFHQGDYQGAKEALAGLAAPAARVYHALSRAATGECPAASAGLHELYRSMTDPALRRAAGLGFVQCAVSWGGPGEAWPVLDDLMRAGPGDADVLYLAARLHMKAWNDTVHQMYRAAPASYRVNQISGEIFEIQGRFSEAAAEFRKAIAKNPAALNLHFRLGRALLLESRTPEALEAAQKEFEAELKLNPGDAAAEYQVAQILAARQRAADAAPRYERAIALDGSFTEALIALGKLRVDEKRYAEAIGLLERAVAQAPASEAARYSLMLAYRNAGRAEDALRQKEALEKLQQPPAGEFTEFLRKLGEQQPVGGQAVRPARSPAPAKP
jgi:tetratricopeptide (TPR) repeat protein